MTSLNKWWILCVFLLPCVAFFGRCSRVSGRGGVQTERFIFNELCALKKMEGPCKAIKERFYFDIDTGRCDSFDYGGCNGNANNFETLAECEEMCVVSANKSPCHLEEAPGPCRGLVTRYLYDNTSQECRQFFYGGCFGNANNFRSMRECQVKCQNPGNINVAPTVTVHTASSQLSVQPLKSIDFNPPDFCHSAIDKGTCEGDERRFAYNPKSKKCHSFHYTGCGGNKNNFGHKRHCVRMCMNLRNHKQVMIRIKKKNINNILFRSV